MIVMKFGGTSVGNADMIRQAVRIIKERLHKQPAVVVSAVSKITDLLIEAARQAERGTYLSTFQKIEQIHRDIISKLSLSKDIADEESGQLMEALDKIQQTGLSRKELDNIASFGERISAKIVADYGKGDNLKTQNYNAYDIGMLTNNNFGQAEVLDETYRLISGSIAKIPKDTIPVITGFIGKTKTGEITTLGRGGSDYTAAVIGAAVNAEEVEIWTDVDGVMTADPKTVNGAKTVQIVSFEEAAELSYFGAKVLHPKTILPVISRNIPVKVLNTYNPSGEGTTILKQPDDNTGLKITSIACKKQLSVVNIHSPRMFMAHGYLNRIFKVFAENKVSVDMISTSEVNVSVTIDNKANSNVSKLIEELSQIGEVQVENNKASVFVVGRGIKRTPGVSGQIFGALAQKGINVEMISQGASEINIGFVINESEADTAVQALHQTFFAN